MVDFRVMGKFISALRCTQGAKGGITLAGRQLEWMAQQVGEREGETLQRMLRSFKSPTLEIGYKAKSNYTIGAFRLRDGENVVAQGATSITRPGATNSVVKAHLSVGENGNILQARGFVDGGQAAKLDDLEMGILRKGGIVASHASTGQAAAYNVVANEGALVEGAKAFNAEDLLEKYVEATRNGQRALDRMMLTIRQGLKGQQPPATPVAVKAPVVVSPKTVALDKAAKLAKPVDVKADEGINKALDEIGKNMGELRKSSFRDFTAQAEELEKQGLYTLFHPKTGECKVIKATNITEAIQKLKSLS